MMKNIISSQRPHYVVGHFQQATHEDSTNVTALKNGGEGSK